MFSFGVVVYEIYTQTEPWRGVSGVEAANAVGNGKRMDIPLECPSLLNLIMVDCWKHDPKDRPEFSGTIIINLFVTTTKNCWKC